MTDFKAALAARKAALATPDTKMLSVALGDESVDLKFHGLPATIWTAITAKHQPRPSTPLDMNYGYNWHASSDEAARLCVVRVEDDQDVPFEYVEAFAGANGQPPVEGVDEWGDLVSVLSAPDLTAIRNVVWELNEWVPGLRTQAAKKASTVKPRRKRS